MPLIVLHHPNSGGSMNTASEAISRIERTPGAGYTAVTLGRGVIEVRETPEEIQALILEASRRAQSAADVPATLQSIAKWFKRAVPNPNAENRSVQIGCHFEEVAEMAEALGLPLLAEQVHTRANEFKAGRNLGFNRQEDLLDALCDQIVTVIGVGHMFGFDILGALAEVNRSNWSKFDSNGQPLFNEQGKIKKGPNYTPPNLGEYLG